MAVRTFSTLDQLRSAPFDLPSSLRETAENCEARSEAWAAYHFRRGGREIWTLALPDEGAAIQWRDGERHKGQWKADRQAVRIEERRVWGLYNLEGKAIPADAFDDEDEAGGSYTPAFGDQKDRRIP